MPPTQAETAVSGGALRQLLRSVRSCSVCAPHLPLGANPVLRAHTAARILLIGQAPGIRVHQTGIPWNDRSGEKLRHWLGVTASNNLRGKHLLEGLWLANHPKLPLFCQQHFWDKRPRVEI